MKSAKNKAAVLKAARLHDRGMQIEVVRHDRRAEDTDRDVEHRGIGDDLRARHEATRDVHHVRLRQYQFHDEATGDDDQQCDDERLQLAEAALVKEQDEHDIKRGDADADDDGDAEQ
jgi:hypothetical protein